MRAVFSEAAVVILLLVMSEAANACTCTVNSLSKRFRKADVIFVGRLSIEPDEPSTNIQNYAKELPVLEVVKAFKGVKKEYVAVGFDFDGATGGGGSCPWFYKFEKDEEYLVFAYGRGLKVIVECSDTRPLQAKNDDVTEQISRLDSFWFRTEARVWPF
jgi:hypothetical protein